VSAQHLRHLISHVSCSRLKVAEIVGVIAVALVIVQVAAEHCDVFTSILVWTSHGGMSAAEVSRRSTAARQRIIYTKRPLVARLLA
jgi:L-asparagine transporter-like permease